MTSTAPQPRIEANARVGRTLPVAPNVTDEQLLANFKRKKCKKQAARRQPSGDVCAFVSQPQINTLSATLPHIRQPAVSWPHRNSLDHQCVFSTRLLPHTHCPTSRYGTDSTIETLFCTGPPNHVAFPLCSSVQP